jgi:ornithine cyclodeaminase/alanine dehydrogenase-like protein (mu-crystallin family)
LSGSEVRGLLNVRDVLRAVENTFRDIGKGAVFHPAKEPIWLNDNRTNMIMAMPAYLKGQGLASVKWVSMFKEQLPGYPTCGGTILILNSAENGQPYAILEATLITAMRTAGGHGAIAAKYLAKRDSSVLAVIGCGEEGRAGVDALLELFPLEQVYACDISDEAVNAFERHVGNRATVVRRTNAEKAVRGSDIVLMATTSRKPLVLFDWLPKGCTVLGLYSFYDLEPICSKRADKWVLGSKFTDGKQIVGDPLLEEHGLSMDNVYADLGEIVTGQVPGRENESEIIVYSCLGMGALDAAVGETVYRGAVEKGIGTILDLA